MGRFGTYYPAKYKSWKKSAESIIATQCKTRFNGVVCVRCEFVFAVPKSYSKKARAEALENGCPPGDIDNLQKALFDAMTGAGVWDDDKLVVEVTARKRYGESSGIMVAISARQP